MKLKDKLKFWKPMECAETGCNRKVYKSVATPDGLKIPLCKEHYAKWMKPRG